MGRDYCEKPTFQNSQQYWIEKKAKLFWQEPNMRPSTQTEDLFTEVNGELQRTEVRKQKRLILLEQCPEPWSRNMKVKN